MEQQGRTLMRQEEIAGYTGRSIKVVKKWIRQHNFPAVKIDGRWESHTALIDKYRAARIKRRIVQEQ